MVRTDTEKGAKGVVERGAAPTLVLGQDWVVARDVSQTCGVGKALSGSRVGGRSQARERSSALGHTRAMFVYTFALRCFRLALVGQEGRMPRRWLARCWPCSRAGSSLHAPATFSPSRGPSQGATRWVKAVGARAAVGRRRDTKSVTGAARTAYGTASSLRHVVLCRTVPAQHHSPRAVAQGPGAV